ncbi:hypothetical protein [Parabacteroides sp. PF5-9]|uniref:hypothetical protein n=1 Tax=Parabacteroides sp. PF5-9 TaxID=1742404 RepID=UPI0024772414|nr:hypothetical protein [Parabacteroides sp. PF5-9]MDH6356665.1 hypothetical protein [Parabacteroides sp. PF5-9]
MNKIFFITFVSVSMLVSLSALAQDDRSGNRRERPHFDREAFEARRNAFITAEMNLTPDEAAVFIPLCNELRQKKFEIGNDCRQLSREMSRKKSITDAEYLKTIDECLQVGIREAQLEEEYYRQFKNILPPAKLYKYRDAEMKFARHFMSFGEREKREGNSGKRE